MVALQFEEEVAKTWPSTIVLQCVAVVAEGLLVCQAAQDYDAEVVLAAMLDFWEVANIRHSLHCLPERDWSWSPSCLGYLDSWHHLASEVVPALGAFQASSDSSILACQHPTSPPALAVSHVHRCYERASRYSVWHVLFVLAATQLCQERQFR